jgi:hypothetical protein
MPPPSSAKFTGGWRPLMVGQNREWFQCSRTKAIETVKAAAGSAGKAEKDRAVEEERQHAVHEQ